MVSNLVARYTDGWYLVRVDGCVLSSVHLWDNGSERIAGVKLTLPTEEEAIRKANRMIQVKVRRRGYVRLTEEDLENTKHGKGYLLGMW